MYDLSSFYKDYSPNGEYFQTIFTIYDKVTKMVSDYMAQVDSNKIISTVETYRTVPFQKASVDEATYDLTSIMTDPVIVSKFNLTTMVVQDRISFFNTANLRTKKDILTTAQKFLLLSASRNSALDKVNPMVVDFELYDENDERLIRNVDFVLDSNMIFLFGNCATPSVGKTFVLKNISVDLNSPEKYIGSNVKLPYNDILTKPEYREVCQMLLYGALGGPTIKNIRDAMRVISGLSEIDVYDKYTKDLDKQRYWTTNTNPLSEFDFVVTLPGDKLSDSSKLTLFINYLKTIKPVYSNLILSPFYQFFDVYDMKSKDTMTFSFWSNPVEIIRKDDSLLTCSTTNKLSDAINCIERMSTLLPILNLVDKLLMNTIPDTQTQFATRIMIDLFNFDNIKDSQSYTSALTLLELVQNDNWVSQTLRMTFNVDKITTSSDAFSNSSSLSLSDSINNLPGTLLGAISNAFFDTITCKEASMLLGSTVAVVDSFIMSNMENKSQSIVLSSLQAGGPSDTIIVKGESNAYLSSLQLFDSRSNAGTQTKWFFDDDYVNLFDDINNVFDADDGIRYSDPIFSDRCNITMIKN